MGIEQIVNLSQQPFGYERDEAVNAALDAIPLEQIYKEAEDAQKAG